jgi:hypothetical protein
MNSIRKYFSFLIIVSFMVPGLLPEAQAQDYMRSGDKSLCKIGEVMRRVEVRYYEEEKQVPCEVHYYKDTEEPGEDRVLWRAENQADFCENKMSAFVDELTGLGWYCQSQMGMDIPSTDPMGMPPEN